LSDDESFRISKEILPSLDGFGFVETALGDLDGAIKQFRNETGIHVREYSEYFEIHRDSIDPRKNPLGHLVRDSPETLVAFGVASLLSRDNVSKNRGYGSPLDFLGLFFSLNRFFRFLKKLLF
jgi:hypothetical protein